MADIDGVIQSIADKKMLIRKIDEMGPNDYAVLVRFIHADQEAKTGYPSVTRTCFGHVARGLLTEAGDLLYSNDD
jgi:hypothetical protein